MNEQLNHSNTRKPPLSIRRFNRQIDELNEHYSNFNDDDVFLEYRYFLTRFIIRGVFAFIFLLSTIASIFTTYYFHTKTRIIFYILIGVDVLLFLITCFLFLIRRKIKYKTKFLKRLNYTINEIDKIEDFSKIYKIEYIANRESINFYYAKRHKRLTTFKYGYDSGVFAIHCLDNYFRIDKIVPIIISSCTNYGYFIHTLSKYIELEYKKFISNRRFDRDYERMFSYLKSHNLSLKNIEFTIIENNYWNSRIEEEYVWVKNLNLFDVSWMGYK